MSYLAWILAGLLADSIGAWVTRAHNGVGIHAMSLLGALLGGIVVCSLIEADYISHLDPVSIAFAFVGALIVGIATRTSPGSSPV